MERIVVAIRKADHTGPAARATLGKCSVCGAEVLLSPASLRHIRSGSPVACSVCMAEAFHEYGPPAGVEFPTDAEMREARGIVTDN